MQGNSLGVLPKNDKKIFDSDFDFKPLRGSKGIQNEAPSRLNQKILIGLARKRTFFISFLGFPPEYKI